MTKESMISLSNLANALKVDGLYADSSIASEVISHVMANASKEERLLFRSDSSQDELALIIAGAERVRAALRVAPTSFKDDLCADMQYVARCKQDKLAALSCIAIEKSAVDTFFDKHTLPYLSELFPDKVDQTDEVIKALPESVGSWTTSICLDDVMLIVSKLRESTCTNGAVNVVSSKFTRRSGAKSKFSDDECKRIYMRHYPIAGCATVSIRNMAISYPWDKTAFEPVQLYKTGTAGYAREVHGALLQRIKAAIKRGRKLTPISERPANDPKRLEEYPG